MKDTQSMRASCLSSFARGGKQKALIFLFWETDSFHSMNVSVTQKDEKRPHLLILANPMPD